MEISGIEQISGNAINMQSSNINVQDLNKSIVTESEEQTKTKEHKYDKEFLDKSLEKLNKFLEDDKVHAEYSVHKDLGDVMIKIVNDNTREVIMELPSEKILDMVASMCKQFGLLDKKV
ncbi:flagellar protein FlaG [Clostridium saccharobutylicum]|uniref:Flagellar protein FlaG n=1 Tax=Clostridium saccharobutylicum TaxID=169679 RepID=A0A1S8NIG7_CLOSA|nr:flagellar protein FlaG [Clostridium saccharobutylicum]OOM16275.1 flagellar protein FlaG [Clostridium saccharobutylicum]